MVQARFDNVLEAVEKPFFVRDTFIFKGLTFLCQITVLVRFIYMKTHVIIKYLIGLPLLLFNWQSYAFYFLFVIWSRVLDTRFHYDFSGTDFSLKYYFKVLFFRLLLFIITALMMDAYYRAPFGWLGFIYSLPMCFLAVGYTVPVFDYRLSNIE